MKTGPPHKHRRYRFCKPNRILVLWNDYQKCYGKSSGGNSLSPF